MKVEVRNDSVLIEGYVNAVMRDSKVLNSIRGKFVEVVEERTFAKAIEKADNIFLLHNHKKDRVLGSIKDGNLELKEDNIGLHARCEIRDAEVVEKARAGKLTGWSFGFSCNECRFEDSPSGIPKRYLSDINLYEVSILDIPAAYNATSVEVRGEEETLMEERGCETEFEIINITEKEKVVEEQRAEMDLSSLYNAIKFIKIKK